MKRLSVLTIVAVMAVLALADTEAYAGLNVTTSSDADALVNNILGSGITVISGTPTYTGADIASGFFTNGAASGIGIKSGIILTSGNASLAQGANSGDGTTGDNQLPGDADLNAALPAGHDSYDATVLEFDFTSEGGDLFFNYVFASEEYNEYVREGYNDIFAFFLDGTNIALIPGTTTEVSVDTINGGNPFGTNPSNPAYFNNNDLDDGGPLHDFEYDGFTDVLTAQALDLDPGTHHIKLAIADVGDYILDSAVLLEAGTFSDTPTTIPAPGAMLLGTLGAGVVGWLRRRRAL